MPIYFEEKIPTPLAYLVLHAYQYMGQNSQKANFTQFFKRGRTKKSKMSKVEENK